MLTSSPGLTAGDVAGAAVARAAVWLVPVAAAVMTGMVLRVGRRLVVAQAAAAVAAAAVTLTVVHEMALPEPVVMPATITVASLSQHAAGGVIDAAWIRSG